MFEASLHALRGHVVVIYFWATWTPEAARRMTDANDWWHVHRDAGIELIGVSYNGKHQQPKEVESFRARYGIDFPNLMDGGSGELHAAYKVDVLPTVVVVDVDGKIRQYLRQDDQTDHWEIGAFGIP